MSLFLPHKHCMSKQMPVLIAWLMGWSCVPTAYLNTFEENKSQEQQLIRDTQSSVVALLEHSSRVRHIRLSHDWSSGRDWAVDIRLPCLFLSEHQSSAAAVRGHCAGAPVHAGRSEFQRDRDAEVSKHSQRPFLRSVSLSSTVHRWLLCALCVNVYKFNSI